MANLRRSAYCALLLSAYLAANPHSISSQVVVRVRGDETGWIDEIVQVGEEIWLATPNGAFRLDRKANRAVRVGGAYTSGINSIASVNGQVWLAAGTGIFQVNRNTNQAIGIGGPEILNVNSLVAVNGEIWVGARQGAFRVDRIKNEAVPVGGLPTGAVNAIVPVNGEIWVGAGRGAFRVDRTKNEAVPVEGPPTGAVNAIVPVNGEIWVGAGQGAFRVDRTKNEAVPVGGSPTGEVNAIVPVNGEIWLATRQGAFRVAQSNKQAVPVGGPPTGAVNAIVPVNGEIWVGADHGAFRLDLSKNQAVPLAANTLSVKSILLANNEIWLAAGYGAFRLDTSTKIQVNLEGHLPWVEKLWKAPVWLEGDTRPFLQYIGSNLSSDSHNSVPAGPVRVIWDSDRNRLFERANDGGNWSPVTDEGPIIRMKPGRTKLYVAIRDHWGNDTSVYNPQLIDGLVIPTWSLSFLLPILGTGFCLVCLMLAPYVRYCHMLLMNPFLRNWVSFGTVPLLLTVVPPIRTHMFRRYCRNLTAELGLRSLADRYVIPEEQFAPAAFSKTLSTYRVVGLHGQSGLGKSAFLTHLAYEFARRRSAARLLHRATPILIDLSFSAGQEPVALVRSQLKKFGDLGDEKLIDALLDDGGFLFLFDGLNEISEVSQEAIVQFTDVHRNHSYACLSTQVATQTFRRVSTLVTASPLSDEKVAELVRSISIDPETKRAIFDPEILLGQFSPQTFDICRNPFQLELAIEMWRRSGEIPGDLDKLYSRALGSLTDKATWTAKGFGDYPDVLWELAFNMLVQKRPYDPENDYLPGEIRAELDVKGMIIERGGVLEFRHDRIRAYLASHHFALRWRSLLAEATRIDSNWDLMLEFYLSSKEGGVNARDLMRSLTSKDVDAAIRIVRWGLRNRPTVFADWQEEFGTEIGKQILALDLSQ